jgi:hypothetical protein
VMSVSSLSHGQKIATSFRNAIDNKGISVENLDKAYQSALHNDSTKAAFNGHSKEFTEAYISLLKELGSFLKKNNFSWAKQTRCFNRIYFNKKGEIDYFLFDFPELEEVKEQEFERLLNQFIQNYKFPMTNGVKFAQCSPVKYSD